MAKFGLQPIHTIPHMGVSLENSHTGGGHPDPTPARTHRSGGGWLDQPHREGVRDVTVGPHTLPTPAPIPTQAPTPHIHLQGNGPTKGHIHPGLHPPTSTSKGVGQPRGQQLPHGCPSIAGVGRNGALVCHSSRLRSRSTGSGDGRTGSGPPLPFTKRTLGEGSGALANPPPLCMWGGGRCGPPFHLGRGIPHEGAHGGSRHPQPDLVEGDPLLSASLRGEGTLNNVSILDPSLDPA